MVEIWGEKIRIAPADLNQQPLPANQVPGIGHSMNLESLALYAAIWRMVRRTAGK